jgi:hypothetical protein
MDPPQGALAKGTYGKLPNEGQGAQKDRKVLRSAACRLQWGHRRQLDWQTDHDGSIPVAATRLLGFAFRSFNSVCSFGFVTTFQQGQFRTEFVPEGLKGLRESLVPIIDLITSLR